MTSLVALEHTNEFSESYPQLSDTDQCLVFLRIGQLACSRGEIANDELVEKADSFVRSVGCPSCDEGQANSARDLSSDSILQSQLMSLFECLLQLPQLHRRKRSSVMAMTALKRLLMHNSALKSQDLTGSICGQWCIRALQNPVRDIRIAAGFVDLHLFIH